ncbi:MAG: ArnT family glycosyltransferase [Candidatus Bilamarchaeum sp.]
MIKTENSHIKLPALLATFTIIFYLSIILFQKSPFAYDEGTYAIMISEFSKNPSSILPTITGVYTEWKPPLFTWVYAIFYLILQKLPIQKELLFRIPSAILGGINVWLIYNVALKFVDNKRAIISSIIFLTTPIVIFSSTTAMMEAFSIFLCLFAIDNYLAKKFWPAGVILGSIILVKWIYVLVPIIFLGVYFFRSKEMRQYLQSLLLVPSFAIFYIILSSWAGSLPTLVEIITLDISRPSPSLNPGIILIRIFWMIISTAPLSIFFLYFVKDKDFRAAKNIPLIIIGMIAFLMTISSAYIFWYASTCIFAFAIIISTKIDHKDIFSLFVIACIVILNLVLYYPIAENVKINSQVDIEKIAHLIDGKQVYVVEPQLFYDNWWSINKLYNGTNRSYLLLEQNNPGILYHLFNNNSQYDRITPIYSAYGQRPDCDKDILIYHKGMYVKKESEANVIPNCFELVANSTNYNVYRNK